MAKQTHYQVSGTLTSKPEGLPKELKVKEVTVDVVPSARATSIFDAVFTFTHREYAGDFILSMAQEGPGAFTPTDKLFTREELISFRDRLTSLLNETSQDLRVFVDRDGSVLSRWWEVEPDKLIYSGSRESAKQIHAKYPSEAWPYDKVNRDYGPLILVAG